MVAVYLARMGSYRLSGEKCRYVLAMDVFRCEDKFLVIAAIIIFDVHIKTGNLWLGRLLDLEIGQALPGPQFSWHQIGDLHLSRSYGAPYL